MDQAAIQDSAFKLLGLVSTVIRQARSYGYAIIKGFHIQWRCYYCQRLSHNWERVGRILLGNRGKIIW